jgi:hypothetical protein
MGALCIVFIYCVMYVLEGYCHDPKYYVLCPIYCLRKCTLISHLSADYCVQITVDSILCKYCGRQVDCEL